MPVIARHRFDGKDLGLLAILYPGVRVLKGPHFPPFIPDARIIVVSDDEAFPKYPKKQVIQIIRSATDDALDTRKGFLRMLPKLGVKATDHEVRFLVEEASDEEFWSAVKLAPILKRFPSIPPIATGPKRHSTVFNLFDKLFEDFDAVYRHFHELCKTRKPTAVLSVLLDMMTKARNPRAHAVSPYYGRILKKNHPYLPLWLLALEKYYLRPHNRCKSIDPDRQKWIMLTLFAACSAHTRPQEGFRFTEYDCVEFKLSSLGFNPADPAVKKLFPGALPD